MSLLVDAVATFRLTRLVQQDHFPPIVAAKTTVRWCITGPRVREYYDELAYNCPWCLSFWLGVAVVIARRVAPRVWDPLAKALAFSAASGVISERG